MIGLDNNTLDPVYLNIWPFSVVSGQ